MDNIPNMNNTPAGMLEGKILENNWIVLEKINKKENNTGGCFSVGYKVRNEDTGQSAFLKAVDFSPALQASDILRDLQAMLADYNFERDLLKKCKEKKITRIMTAIGTGQVKIPGFIKELSFVHYFIFELARGDIRDLMVEFKKLDLIWCLKLLHNVAVGIKQLQQNGIAHQDLKPSNILQSTSNGFKISDLGRASDKNIRSSNDDKKIPGDRSYAPLELWYDNADNYKIKEFEKRFLTDLYLCGSLIFSIFTNMSATQAIRTKLKNQKLSRSFKQDLPYIQHAFEQIISDLRKEMEVVAGELTEDIITIAKQLCEPDPNRRGDPKWRNNVTPNYDMRRYVSKFDLISKKAQFLVK